MEKTNKKEDDVKDIGTQKEVVSKLIESSALTKDFYLMMILSSIIVCLGLLLNNMVIVIGGMLVTPFLSPLLMLSLACVLSDFKIIKRSLFVILKSAGVIVATSFVATLLVPRADVDSSLIYRLVDINLSYFYVSLAAGFAAGYVWARPKLSSVLPGVAISVALLPPLVSFAISLTFFDMSLVVGTIRSFAMNMMGIILSATFVFALLGFYRVKGHVQKEIKQEDGINNN
ncbi:TIGR00341 family protein [Patescibacteria group bacterium]|nr:TIGR00341 family protein [Patescibacteria group bacterium]MBU2633430.1 TIGR00341 family protein [Patescibacteria group bacterium]